MRKNERHALIKQLINNHVIRNQAELLTTLSQYGATVTQSTISRDIRDLNIVKTVDKKGNHSFKLLTSSQHNGTSSGQAHLIQAIWDVVISVEQVHFLMIIKTMPDNAALLCSIIDDIESSEIVCSIAGFDTIVLVTHSDEEAKALCRFYQQQLDRKKTKP